MDRRVPGIYRPNWRTRAEKAPPPRETAPVEPTCSNRRVLIFLYRGSFSLSHVPRLDYLLRLVGRGSEFRHLEVNSLAIYRYESADACNGILFGITKCLRCLVRIFFETCYSRVGVRMECFIFLIHNVVLCFSEFSFRLLDTLIGQ